MRAAIAVGEEWRCTPPARCAIGGRGARPASTDECRPKRSSDMPPE